MADWRITVARSARKELERLAETHRDRIVRNIEKLRTNPRPRGAKKLTGAADLWRIRVGDYRIVYVLNNDERLVDIAVIRHRRDAYR